MSPKKCVVIMLLWERKYQSTLNYTTYCMHNKVSKLHDVRSHHDYMPQKRQDKTSTKKYFQCKMRMCPTQ